MTAVARQKPWVAEQPPGEILLKNANVVDVAAGKVLTGHHVHLKDGRIAAVTPNLPSTPDAQVIDLDAKYICPGLIDCHVHLTVVPGETRIRDLFAAHPDAIALRSAWTAKQMLRRGFTTVRDTAGASFALRDAIAEGVIPGPRLFICGKALSQTGGHGDLRLPHEDESAKCCGGHAPGFGRICDGVPACLEAARDELRQGADFLKIMTGGGVASPADPLEMIQFTAAEIQAITESARNRGTYVTAHAYSVEAIRHAIDNGVMGIEHGNFIDQATAKLCAQKGVFVTPTIVTYEALRRPPFDQFLPESGRQKVRQVVDRGLGAFKILQEAGVTICYGTDLLAGMQVAQNEEFEIRRAVQSDLEVLRSATINAAQLLRMEGQLGTVSEGAIADLLILRENPLDDVTSLNRMEQNCCAILKEGRPVRSRLEGLRVDELYT